MDWNEFARISAAFQARFGRQPPTILTFEGALTYMRDALGEMAPENPMPPDTADTNSRRERTPHPRRTGRSSSGR